MTSATIPGLDTAPTKHRGLLAWVQEVAELTQPDRVVFADGSEEEYQRLCEQLVAAGTFQLDSTSAGNPAALTVEGTSTVTFGPAGWDGRRAWPTAAHLPPSPRHSLPSASTVPAPHSNVRCYR